MDYKRNNFLYLIDDNFLLIKLTYTKDSAWLNHFGYSNTLYVWTTKVIINYASIEKYYLIFFLRELFEYSYKNYLIESICYILHDCRRYNKFWNSDRELLKNFAIFLEFNL